MNDGHDENEEVDDGVRGVDYSWPMHHHDIRHANSAEREQVAHRYSQFTKGCSFYYTEQECSTSDRERMNMNFMQPKSMQNYTTAGYAKVATPPVVLNMLQQFYQQHKDTTALMRETWPPGNIYINHWASTVKMLPIAGVPPTSKSSRGGGGEDEPQQPSLSFQQRQDIIAHIQPILETWSKMPLQATSLYGIREYRRGSILSPHCDRLPLVLSAIINVAQSGMEEPWPLEVIDHSGQAINVTMEPGDMVNNICR